MDKSKVAAVLSRALTGSGSAREELFAFYRPYLRLKVNGLVGKGLQRRSDGSDLVQQTCADAVVGLEGFRGATEPEFTGWLVGILQRKAAEAYRFNMQAKRDIRREQARAETDSSASISWFSTTDTGGPVESVIRGESALILAKALSELPRDQARAVSLRYLEEEKIKDIAEAMDCTNGRVAGLLRRGIQAIKANLNSDFLRS